jgi:DNA repair protein RadC
MKTNSLSTKKTYRMVSKLRLVKEPTELLSENFTTSWQAADFARTLYKEDIEIYESFYVLFLNRANRVTDYCLLSQGGCSGTVVDPKLLLNYALGNLTQALIFVHNHPSGNTQPSEADKKLTSNMVTMLKVFEIALLDHIIITREGYFSFADHGLIS